MRLLNAGTFLWLPRRLGKAPTAQFSACTKETSKSSARTQRSAPNTRRYRTLWMSFVIRLNGKTINYPNSQRRAGVWLSSDAILILFLYLETDEPFAPTFGNSAMRRFLFGSL